MIRVAAKTLSECGTNVGLEGKVLDAEGKVANFRVVVKRGQVSGCCHGVYVVQVEIGKIVEGRGLRRWRRRGMIEGNECLVCAVSRRSDEKNVGLAELESR